MSSDYRFREIEPRWQAYWEEHGVYRAANPGEPGAEKPKYYALDFFPYPSGAGLHVGHPLGYIASDIVARYRRARGFNVLHPMGWDAFGLPAEQYAIETGVHPAITTRRNIETFKGQLRRVGLSYDWSREVATCDPAYYRWTQWIFLRIFNSWYDPEYRWSDAAGRSVLGKARPIDELPIPQDVKGQGPAAVQAYQDDHRLAYLAEVPVNWCPALGTVLANEEVTAEGRSERGNHPVFRRPMKQWMLRITEYADRLLADLDPLDWPEPIKLMQRNWIGRSEGAYVDFELANGSGNMIRVYTTRPDTLFGATYLVLAPEHRLVPLITTSGRHRAVQAYVEQARQKSELARTAETKDKTGVFTGSYALNPVNRERIPIWVADYVLVQYGTGSIMAVPGGDKRDLAFAEQHGLPVRQVVTPPAGVDDWRGYEGYDGTMVASPPADADGFEGICDLNGLPVPDAKHKITFWLEANGVGEGTVQYKLRDWLFSRQRYWGEPFPILHTPDGFAIGEEEANLPVLLPEMEDFRPKASDDPQAQPQTPLSRAPQWVQLERDGRGLTRELNTMPQWAGSCWYYLRFCDPTNGDALVGRDAERYWMGSGTEADGGAKFGGVDLYLGGAEHAVLHLLYARFWHKVLYDLGVVTTPEPFHKLFNQGMIGARAYHDERGAFVYLSEVVEGPAVEVIDRAAADEAQVTAAIERGLSREQALEAVAPRVTTSWYHDGKPVIESFEKMSKTRRNVVNPDAIIEEYGADTLRLYEMYMGPLEAAKPWNTRDIIGVHRFLQRVWRLVVVEQASRDADTWRLNPAIGEQREDELERLLHKTIRKVQEDIEKMAFNTAIAQMIVWSNAAQKAKTIHRDQLERFVRMLAPFAPHISEELWQRLGGADSVALAEWPAYDPALTVDDEVEIAVQINGKVRARVRVASDADDAAHVAAATQAVAAQLDGKSIRKSIVVAGRLVNLIV